MEFHAALSAPTGITCECPMAPCGSHIVNDNCNWHRNAANFLHAAANCDRLHANRARKTTARPESVGLVDAIHNAHTNH